MYVIDLNGVEHAVQATVEQDYELNGNQALSMSLTPTKVNALFIHDLDKMWEIVDFDGVVHKIIYLKPQGKGDSLTIEIKAVPLFFDKFDNDRIYSEYNEHMTAHKAFSRIFNGTGYFFTLHDTFYAVEWEGFGAGETRLETFKRALERYKAEFVIIGNTIHLKALIGRDTQFQYRYKLNASNIAQEIDATEFWTYAKGYGDYGDGDGGEDWQDAKLVRDYTSPLAKIAQIGIRHAPPIKNGNITTASFMDSELKRLVDESLKVSVTADLHDLRNQGYALAQPLVGDRVFLIDERIGFDQEVRVVSLKVVKDWRGDVIDVSATLGDVGITKRHQSNLQTAIDNITGIVDGGKKLPWSAYDDAILVATNALQRAQTELIFDNGIIAKDKNDPNKVVIYNSAGIGISDDGGASFSTALTGDGIVADYITAGSLRGINIIGTNIISFNQLTNDTITMSDGEIETFKDGKLRFGIRGNGLEAYHWETEEVIATFRASHVDNKAYGAGIIAYGDYLSFGRNEGSSDTSLPQLRFSWDEDYDKVNIYGGAGERDSGALMLRATRKGGSAGGYVPGMIIDNRTSDGVAYSGFRIDVGRDNRRPDSSDFRSGFEVWQYKGDGKGGSNQLFKIDTGSNGNKYMNAWVDRTYLSGSLSVGKDVNLSGALTADNHLFSDALDAKPYGGGRHLYIRPWGSGEVRFTRTGTTDEYRDLRARWVYLQDGVIQGGNRGDAQIVLEKDSEGERVWSASISNRHYSGSANMFITSHGTLGRVTSARKYKLLEEPIKHNPYNILKITPKTWYDKKSVESYADSLNEKGVCIIDEEEATPIERVPGAIAEDFINVGLDLYVTRDKWGDVESLMYDRAWLPLIPIVSDHEEKVTKLERRINEQDKLIKSLKSDFNKILRRLDLCPSK